MDINQATDLNREVEAAIEDAFEYHAWSANQEIRGRAIRKMLELAVKSVVMNVPPCPDRSAAIRKIREARMDCNSAITHGGKY